MKDQTTQLRYIEEAVKEGSKTDVTILSLSSGALVLSITFLIGSDPSAGFLLVLCWLSLTLSIVCFIMRSIFKANTTLELAQGKSFDELDQKIMKYSYGARKVMLVAFLLGVAFLVLFAMQNVPLTSGARF
jgi:hypothetical protein